jgi:hypothetical protein
MGFPAYSFCYGPMIALLWAKIFPLKCVSKDVLGPIVELNKMYN